MLKSIITVILATTLQSLSIAHAADMAHSCHAPVMVSAEQKQFLSLLAEEVKLGPNFDHSWRLAKAKNGNIDAATVFVVNCKDGTVFGPFPSPNDLRFGLDNNVIEITSTISDEVEIYSRKWAMTDSGYDFVSP